MAALSVDVNDRTKALKKLVKKSSNAKKSAENATTTTLLCLEDKDQYTWTVHNEYSAKVYGNIGKNVGEIAGSIFLGGDIVLSDSDESLSN